MDQHTDAEAQQRMDEQPGNERPTQDAEANNAELGLTPVAPPEMEHGIEWVFVGPQGLRAGWSVLLWLALMTLFLFALGFAATELHLVDRKPGFTPKNLFFNELIAMMALLASVALMALIERRHMLDYNLRGTRRTPKFFAGLVTGFVALSVLVAELTAGGWLHFNGAALSGAAVIKYGAVWGAMFLLVGCAEEGMFRCYLLATLTRGINFWWALGTVAVICGSLIANHKGNGVWGDYALALAGLLPCLWLHARRVEGSGFWQAAWVTSTLFGFVHTSNGGENWIGIFAAGAVGFVFCVSIWATGSAWWAIGAHAGWDWGETFFYGTPNSGLVAQGHLLNTTVGGNPLWSGGADGPEGSLLIIGVLLLLIAWLAAMHVKQKGRGTEKPRDQEGGCMDSSL